MRDNHDYTFKYILSMTLNRHDNYYFEEKGFEERLNVIGLIRKKLKNTILRIDFLSLTSTKLY